MAKGLMSFFNTPIHKYSITPVLRDRGLQELSTILELPCL
jgi:hypothetical protein